mmetsp:Transcript_3185/g.5318  ORF Transcript_3185/g.5318 Transcript_3185/m.5318 type:complete len:100 (+) Transcript_3185:388-687(+)
MWDMLSLYDTQKRKIEEEAAFMEEKEQQTKLRQFYEQQMDFKRQMRDHEQNVRNQEFQQFRRQQHSLSNYERHFEGKRKQHFSKIRDENLQVSSDHKRF